MYQVLSIDPIRGYTTKSFDSYDDAQKHVDSDIADIRKGVFPCKRIDQKIGDHIIRLQVAGMTSCFEWIIQEVPVAACVATPKGTLIAKANHDPEYPGIDICLRRDDGQDLLLALVETTKTEADLPLGETNVITRVYGKAMNDEYTDRIVHKDIEAYFSAPDSNA